MESIYWKRALEVVNAWSKYQAKKKLFQDANNPETAHRVREVVEKYYGGDAERISFSVNKTRNQFRQALRDFQGTCKVSEVEAIDVAWLEEHVTNAKAAGSLRGKIKRRLNKKAPIVALSEI